MGGANCNNNAKVFQPRRAALPPPRGEGTGERRRDSPAEEELFEHTHHATFAANGAFSCGSCGCAPTSPRYSVPRLNFNAAVRSSVLSWETATAGNSYFPSGREKR